MRASHWVGQHKTEITGCCALLLLSIGIVLTRVHPGVWASILLYSGAGSLVGWFTNHIAIEALFDYWPKWIRRGKGLPYTGVLLEKKDELVDGIVERMQELFSVQVVERRLRLWINEWSQNPDELEALSRFFRKSIGKISRNAELRTTMAEDVHSGLASRNPLSASLVDKDFMTHLILGQVHRRLYAMTAVESLPVLMKKAMSSIEESQEDGDTSIFHVLSDKALQLAADELNAKDPSSLKNEVKILVRDHLGWLEVYGGILGALLGPFSILIS